MWLDAFIFYPDHIAESAVWRVGLLLRESMLHPVELP
jgi:hypothetical protein